MHWIVFYSYILIRFHLSCKHKRYDVKYTKIKFSNPHSGIRRRVTKGLDPVNYSIDFDDGDSSDDEVDE